MELAAKIIFSRTSPRQNAVGNGFRVHLESMPSVSSAANLNSEPLRRNAHLHRACAQSENRESAFGKILLSSTKELPMQMFVASYESQELTEAEAKRRGWDGVSDGMLDYLCDSGERVSKKFPTKEEAQAWLVAEINAGKSVYGCGDIDVMLKMERRCRYCTCRGWKEVQSFLLDGDYLEEREVSDECWDGDE